MTASNESSPLVPRDDDDDHDVDDMTRTRGKNHPTLLVPMGLGPETTHDEGDGNGTTMAEGTTLPRYNDAPSTATGGTRCGRIAPIIAVVVMPSAVAMLVVAFHSLASYGGDGGSGRTNDIIGNIVGLYPTGPYALIESHADGNFFDNYDFYDGPDSIGSGGYNSYVSKTRALELGIAGTMIDDDGEGGGEEEEFAYMSSSPTFEGKRESVRLEGKRRYDRGLFVLDVRHMPDGCGTWPAFWLTDESRWPMNGEIDVLEGTKHERAPPPDDGCVHPYHRMSPFFFIPSPFPHRSFEI